MSRPVRAFEFPAASGLPAARVNPRRRGWPSLAETACRDHNQCVVQFSSRFQSSDRTCNHQVEMFDLHEVIQNVVSHDVVVGKDRRHDCLRGILARQFPRSGLITAMWFGCSQPETKRLVLWNLFEKVLEVPRIIYGSDALERRLQAMSIEQLSGRIGLPAAWLKPAGAPSLARVTDRVSSFRQQLGVCRELRWQRAVNIPGFFQTPDVLACENR